MQQSHSGKQIRTLHHMARSGGTIISRCLAAMDDVMLLSEIHPYGPQFGGNAINPLLQADNWFGVFTEADRQELGSRGTFAFIDAIEAIDDRAKQRGLKLLLRDWTHVDFIGPPVTWEPPYELNLIRVLENRFQVICTNTVRHPIDQWMSYHLIDPDGDHGKITLAHFLRGYRAFAELCPKMGFIRYEDFTNDPDSALKILCERLQIPFDGNYRERWAAYDKITSNNRNSRGAASLKIEKLARREIPQTLLDEFAANDDYQASIELLGYRHDA